MIRWLTAARPRSLPFLIGLCLALLALIGAIDYLTGFEMYFSVFYLVGVGLAAWYIGKGFALVMSVLSVLAWAGGDLAAGVHYSKPWIMIWNALILTIFYFIVVWLLSDLRRAHQELETRVDQRTLALRREIAERQRLESEILKVSEREQRRIGHELHDSLCQHLTATALAGQVLAGELAAKSPLDSVKAGKVVELVEEGIALARNLARGLYPVEMEAEGLMDAYHELAGSVARASKISCVFDCTPEVFIHDDAVATHLFRVGQEAVRNALQHGKPARIEITLSEQAGQVKLTVEDDGVGLPDDFAQRPGLGLRIMAHRAAILGGTFAIEPSPTGGTMVTCAVPNAPSPNTNRASDTHGF